MKITKITALFAFALLALVACKKDDLSQNIPTLTLTELNLLCEKGFNASSAVVKGEFVNVEGDIFIHRESINAWQEAEKDEESFDDIKTEERQFAINSNEVVKIANVVLIPFYIDPSVNSIPVSGSGGNYSVAILAAVNAWTSITGCRVSFTQVNSHSLAKISFFSDLVDDPLPTELRDLDQFSAYSCYPFNGQPGRFIVINDQNQSTLNTDLKRQLLLMHEIGHNLGYRHANDPNQPEQFEDRCDHNINGTNLLPFTPQIDATSIMANGPALLTLTGFNTSDIRAARLLYPTLTGSFTINSVTFGGTGSGIFSNFRKVNFNISQPAATEWFYIRPNVSPDPPNMFWEDFIVNPSINTYTWLFPRNSTFTVTFSGVNYRKDAIGPASNSVIFTTP